jgi:hypothetical protein
MATTVSTYYAQSVGTSILQSSYVALIRQDGTECPIGRVQLGAVSVDSSSDPTYHIVSNTTEIVFAVASSDVAPTTNPVIQIALYTASTGGDQLAITDLSSSKPYLSGDQFRIPIGMFQFKIQKTV